MSVALLLEITLVGSCTTWVRLKLNKISQKPVIDGSRKLTLKSPNNIKLQKIDGGKVGKTVCKLKRTLCTLLY